VDEWRLYVVRQTGGFEFDALDQTVHFFFFFLRVVTFVL